MSLAEVKNMVALQQFNLGGSGGMLPQECIINSAAVSHCLPDEMSDKDLAKICNLSWPLFVPKKNCLNLTLCCHTHNKVTLILL